MDLKELLDEMEIVDILTAVADRIDDETNDMGNSFDFPEKTERLERLADEIRSMIGDAK